MREGERMSPFTSRGPSLTPAHVFSPWVIVSRLANQRTTAFLLLPSPTSYCSLHNRSINQETSCWGNNRKPAVQEDGGPSVAMNRHTWVRIQTSFILKGEGVWLVVANTHKNFSGILYSCNCPHRSGHTIPINPQQDKCYSLFCNFLIAILMGKCYTLKGQSLENGLFYIF